MLKADLHIHTRYSMDCQTPLEKIIERCQELGINCIAIADHGTAEGGLELQKIAPFKVIVAEEILTTHGEIMGMFLKEFPAASTRRKPLSVSARRAAWSISPTPSRLSAAPPSKTP